MSSTTILSVVQHYQRSIEKCQTDEARLLHCLSKLYKLPIKVGHLQETGVGKTVNSLRKYDGEVGAASKALVTKWKAMVAAEEEPIATHCHQNEDNNMNYRRGDDDASGHSNRNTEVTNNFTENKDTSKINQSKSIEHEQITQSENKNQKTQTSHHKPDISEHDASSNLKNTPKTRCSSSPERKHSEKHHKKSKRRDEESKGQEHKKIKEREPDGVKKKTEKHKASSSSSSSRHHRSSDKSNEDHKCSGEIENVIKEKHRHSSHTKREHKYSSDKKGEQQKHNKHSSSSLKDKQQKSEKDSLEKQHLASSAGHHHSRDADKHIISMSDLAMTKTNYTPKSKREATSSTSISAERKRRRHDSEHDSSNDSKVTLLTPKTVKQENNNKSNQIKDNNEDCIDSSMGANFADVLGMLNVPAKRSKKSIGANLKASSTSSIKTSSSTISKNNNTSNDNSQNQKDQSKSKISKLNGIKYSPSSPRNVDVKPDLLSSSAKLEPLDPNIALALPPISTHYRPMPLNQTVMECVFPSTASSNTANASAKIAARMLADDEALSQSISSKTMRTKIYSGVRTGQLIQIPTLFDLCIRVLQKNIDALEYTGGVPFDVLRPILERASPQQLLVFEEYNPYLMEDSDTLWQQHVQRHYRAQKRREMESWREMFLRCQEDQERKLSVLAESIKQSQKIIAAPVRKTQLAFMDAMVKPPRNVQRKQEQYGTKSKLVATPASRVASLSCVMPNAAKTGDVRLRVAATVQDHAQVSSIVRPKKAPLMAKTLQLMRGRHKR